MSSSSSSNSGSNRFCGDAESFSPSHNVTSQQTQHFHQQQLLQYNYYQRYHHHQMYMQYAAAYPMLNNHIVYPPMYAPVYLQDLYYQTQNFYGPQHHDVYSHEINGINEFSHNVLKPKGAGKRLESSISNNGTNVTLKHQNQNSLSNLNKNFLDDKLMEKKKDSENEPKTNKDNEKEVLRVVETMTDNKKMKLKKECLINSDLHDCNNDINFFNTTSRYQKKMDLKNEALQSCDLKKTNTILNSVLCEKQKHTNNSRVNDNISDDNLFKFHDSTKDNHEKNFDKSNSNGSLISFLNRYKYFFENLKKSHSKNYSYPLFTFPLFINSHYNEFIEKQKSSLEKKKEMHQKKNKMISKYFKQNSLENEHLIIFSNHEKIIDFNSKTLIITNEIFQHLSKRKNNGSFTFIDSSFNNSLQSNVEKKNHLFDKKKFDQEKFELSETWASIINSSSGNKISTTKLKNKNSKLKNICNSTILSTLIKSTIDKFDSQQKKNVSTNTSKIKHINDLSNVKSEEKENLGLLLLKIMFDQNLSIFNSNLPVFKFKPKGLINNRNICYMNSIFQVLLHCMPFNRLIKLINDRAVIDNNNEIHLLNTTIKFFNDFVNSSEKKSCSNVINHNLDDTNDNFNYAFNPDSFYNSLISHKRFKHLKLGMQEDAEEFLGYYLDGLNDEFLDSIKKVEFTCVEQMIKNHIKEFKDNENSNTFEINVKNAHKLINDKSFNKNDWNKSNFKKIKSSSKREMEIKLTPIKMIFGGQFKSILMIPSQINNNDFKKSVILDPFQHLQLDISEVDSLEEALINLNKIERVSYKSKNNKEVQISKQNFFELLPKILIIHLKRFSFLKNNKIGIEKLRKRINFSHDLSLPTNFLSKNLLSDNSYKLISVVYHHGTSAEGGHYTCDVLRNKSLDESKISSKNLKSEEKWIRMDDDLMSYISRDDVLSKNNNDPTKNAYVFLYEKNN